MADAVDHHVFDDHRVRGLVACVGHCATVELDRFRPFNIAAVLVDGFVGPVGWFAPPRLHDAAPDCWD